MELLHYQATPFICQYGMIPYYRTEQADMLVAPACGQIQTLLKGLFSIEKKAATKHLFILTHA